MKSQGNASRWLVRWSLAGLFAALLLLGGYFGGRHSGFDRGHADGFAAVQQDGFETGRAEGARQIAETYQRKGPNQYIAVYDVGDLLRELRAEEARLEPSEAGSATNVDALASQIMMHVAPSRWRELNGMGTFSISGFPTNQSLVVSADARHHAQIALLLQSKDDYLAWKRSQQQ